MDTKTAHQGLTDEYLCAKCQAYIPAYEQTEHEDWHLAMQMQSQEESLTQTAQSAPALSAYQQSAQIQKTAQGPAYAPPSHPPPTDGASRFAATKHTNQVIEAANIRAKDEQQMQIMLQNVQFQFRIYNSEIEPDHDTKWYCPCPIHQYQYKKMARYGVQDMWSQAVLYPGETAYNDDQRVVFASNPYRYKVVSPFGVGNFMAFGAMVPSPSWHAKSIRQTIKLNETLNAKAQTNIDAREPKISIWDDTPLEEQMSRTNISNGKPGLDRKDSVASAGKGKTSKLSSFCHSMGFRNSDERAISKDLKKIGQNHQLRDDILREERGRWPDEAWRAVVATYQDKVGMTSKIADLRARCPIQYLHLLRAGYFEPIPVAWANQASNPLKFSIEASAGWRGITPAWRGYEDTAEERLYWVLNHREGSIGKRMKPDFISALEMARTRMASAVEPPPEYFAADDACHVEHTSDGYSKQVMPPPFVAHDQPEQATDDTMILLDVSGSMGFEPRRPIYDQYLVTGWGHSTQPKNKSLAKAILRRFTEAMQNHDHTFSGYDFVTFENHASHIGTLGFHNLEDAWSRVQFGGGTRVMTGWQKVKELHFQKHSESATHHPVYGWIAGPQTPILRLLLLLDGEATDMDEFELDLLACSWAHVTIFLIGVDGCPHHHRHANELQRISDVNHHVSFVDAQGNTPERFVTHELLKRHLGYELSMAEFEELEHPPPYTE